MIFLDTYKFYEFTSKIKDPLYKNGIFNILSMVSNSGFGFIFWLIASKLYSISDVGIATALISSVGLIITFSRFGFDVSQIRFIKAYNIDAIFNTCLWIPAFSAIIVGICYLSLIDFISPSLIFIQQYAIIFILFTFMNSITLTTGTAFLSFRKSEYRFIQNLIMAIRLPLLFVLIFLGSLGIFFSLGLAYLLASIFAIFLIGKFVQVRLQIDKKFATETMRYSLLNYIANILQGLPALIMPILILNLIGPDEAALYFIAFSVGNIVLIIPDAISISFFVEGCHGANVRHEVMKSLKAIYSLSIPLILITIFFGNLILGLFGSGYIVAWDLLIIVVISTLFVTIYQLFIIIQNLRMEIEKTVIITLIRCVLLIGLSYIFLQYWGIIGAGIAWMITYIFFTIGILVFIWNKKWFIKSKVIV